MAAISLLAAAREDYDSAFEWYAARSEAAARRFESEIGACLERIARDPDRFVHLDDNHRQARVRRFPYRIAFQIDGVRVMVVAIVHHSRRPGTWR